jgi:hypothetical protein
MSLQYRLQTAQAGDAASSAFHSAAVCRPPLAASRLFRTFPRALRQSMQRFQLLNRRPPHFVQTLASGKSLNLCPAGIARLNRNRGPDFSHGNYSFNPRWFSRYVTALSRARIICS